MPPGVAAPGGDPDKGLLVARGNAAMTQDTHRATTTVAVTTSAQNPAEPVGNCFSHTFSSGLSLRGPGTLTASASEFPYHPARGPPGRADHQSCIT